MQVLAGGMFHIEQITHHIGQVSKALENQDLPNLGLSLQTLSLAARIAQSQFTPWQPLAALSWESWLASLSFLEQCVEGVMHGDQRYVQLAMRLLTLSQEEYLHLVELAEAQP
jgi:hypothetical protein